MMFQKGYDEKVLEPEYQVFSSLDTLLVPPAISLSSTTVVKIPQSHGKKLTAKQKEKAKRFLEQAVIRQVFEPDRQISLPKSYFKFPKIDFYLNLDCLLNTNGGQNIIDDSNISVINNFKGIEYSEISKKTNGVHVYFTDKKGPEVPLDMLISRLRTKGDSFLYDISEELQKFSSLSFQHSDSSIPEEQKIKTFLLNKERQSIQHQIDLLFTQSKFRPMVIWRGVALEFQSLHVNESFLQLIHYTPEEFQMELALSGIPMIWTSYGYREWIIHIMKSLTSLYSNSSFKSTDKGSGSVFIKEVLTQEGSTIQVEFESYNSSIGSNKLVIEEATQEIIPPKKKTKKKEQQLEVASLNSDKTPENKQQQHNLTDKEKYFINNHYFKIQDFDFNKDKVCKVRLLEQESHVTQEEQQLNISA